MTKSKDNKTKVFTINIILFIISLLMFLFHFILIVDINKNLLVYASFFLIGLMSISVLCFFPKFISLIKMFFSFIFVFFYFAPLEQYTYDVNLWDHITITDDDYLMVNALVLVSILLIFLFYNYSIRKKKINNDNYKVNRSMRITKFSGQALIALDVICFLYFLSIGGLYGQGFVSSNNIINSLQKLLRFIPVSTLLLFIYNAKIEKMHISSTLLSINILIVLILFFPLAGSVSRFFLFGTYIIILYIFFKDYKYHACLPLLLIIGFGFLFPAFNFFKRHSITEIGEFKLTGNNFNTVDFDAYQLFIEGIRYVKYNDFLYGKNILSGLLFFVPRSIWTGKLDPSGEIISSFFNAHFTNLSAPYLIELYLSFGVVGIIIGSILIGKLFYVFDRWIEKGNFIKIGVATIFAGMSIYLLRGSFLPAYSYTMSLVLGFIFTCLCLKFFNKFKY